MFTPGSPFKRFAYSAPDIFPRPTRPTVLGFLRIITSAAFSASQASSHHTFGRAGVLIRSFTPRQGPFRRVAGRCRRRRAMRDDRHVVLPGENGADGEICARDVGKPAEVPAGKPLLALDNQKVDPLCSHTLTNSLPPSLKLVRGKRIPSPIPPAQKIFHPDPSPSLIDEHSVQSNPEKESPSEANHMETAVSCQPENGISLTGGPCGGALRPQTTAPAVMRSAGRSFRCPVDFRRKS